MSSLIFFTDESQALIATDSLAVDTQGNPAFFCSKAHYIPHLKTVIAGTGAGGFANEWALSVSARMVVKGIHNLDYHTPERLRALWSEYKVKYSIPESLTTTVYQFGISEETGNIVTFAYRSTNNFTSEEIGYGTGVKPECDVLEGNLIELIPKMMEQQRSIQGSFPESTRIHIGGEIIAFHLTHSGCNTFKISEFDDFSEQMDFIFANYDRYHS